MGVPPELGTAALRFSFGRTSSEADVEALAVVLPKIVEKVRALAVELQRAP